jgi:hypothetical protein
MKKPTATSHGNNRFTDSPGAARGAETTLEFAALMLMAEDIASLRDLVEKNIDGAKLRWALENKKPVDATPTDADLFGRSSYIEHKPDCPAGGAYTLNPVEEKCTCSIVKHLVERNSVEP